MSADILRRAAALMRERAEAATYTAQPWDVDEIGGVWAVESDGQPLPVSSRSTDADADHIASWHPAVALAVADWLDDLANDVEAQATEGYEIGPRHPALAVARAYLGAP